MSDVIDLVPCPACGAWPGEFCHTLYSKDGSPAGVPTPGHHLARCYLWHAIRGVRAQRLGEEGTHVGRNLRRGAVAGCYFAVVGAGRTDHGKTEHDVKNVHVTARIASDRLRRAWGRW